MSAPLTALPASTLSFLAPYLPPPPSSISSSSSTSVFVTLTYASSLDSRIAAGQGQRTALSGPESKSMTHYLRAHHAAILVGGTTVRVDDPALNCRYPVAVPAPHRGFLGFGGGEDPEATKAAEKANMAAQSPRPVILDPNFGCGLTPSSRVMQVAQNGEGKAPWILVSAKRASAFTDSEQACVATLEAAGAEIIPVPDLLGSEADADDEHDAWNASWEAVLTVFRHRGIPSVMVEGGARVITSMLCAAVHDPERGLVTSPVCAVVLTVAPVYLGKDGVEVAPARAVDRLMSVRWTQLGRDAVLAALSDRFSV
ncbi:dihydrofolate reductase-like domain-containing protein [Limtongia smithiae]|uniref:dihydrofolate reductase-like domain-containing protein n=1 Tax=Limtongia smithiae TaxID=1125753 RepID=UPI0034CF3AB8